MVIQLRWNRFSKGFKISGVTALAAASGGSELASALNGATFGYAGNAMDKALIVSTARSSFNHNNTAGVTVAHVPGYKGLAGASAILPVKMILQLLTTLLVVTAL